MAQDALPAGASGFWRNVRDALRGAPRDYTREPLRRAIFLLAVPMVLENSMESLFAIVDIFWISGLGADAVASVGLTETVLTVLYSIATGVAMATTAMVARRTGEGNLEAACNSAVQAIFLAIAAALSVALPAAFFAAGLLGAMGATTAVIHAGLPFTRIVMASSPLIMLLFTMNAVFRGAGDATISMRVLWAANLVNMALDPCFIYGLGPFPRLGIAGAAVATTIGRGCGVALQCYFLRGGHGRLALARRHFTLDFGILRRLARISAVGSAQLLISQASWIVLVRVIAASGSDAIAGYTVAVRVVIFALMPSWGLSNAAATLTGQNLGAQRPERAEASVWRCGLYNAIFLGAMGLVFTAFAEPLVRFFAPDAEVVRYGAGCLRILSYGYVFYAYGMVMEQAFNGAGDTATPTVISFFSYFCLQIPVAWLLAIHWHMGAYGAFWAVPIAESVLAVVAVLVFRRGAWKKQVV